MLTPEVSKEHVDNFLVQHFAQLEDATQQQGESYRDLIRTARDVALAGGKRLRPYMSMLMYEAYSGKNGEDVLPVAAAQELMHFAMLIHDDIMDGDIIRHGQPNVTGRLMQTYAPYIDDEAERRRRAEHSALLAGDLMIGEAYSLTDELETIDSQVMARTRRLFRQATRTVVGGQLNDVEAPFFGADAVSARRIAHDKTAHYTFVTPLLVGATLAEAPSEELAKLKEIGEKTGIAYQLRDDILGVFGNPAVTGKSSDGDLREGKRTLLAEVFDGIASSEERSQFEALQQFVHANPGERSTVKRMRRLMQPARRIVEHEIHQERAEITRLIGGLAVHDEYCDTLKELVVRSLNRTH